jgi:lipase
VHVSFAHATGFCGSVWNPVIGRLIDTDCVTWDFAGHGSGPSLDTPVDWTLFGSQVLDETRPGGIGVGHSMGAAAMLMAQLSDPRRFGFLVLIEPIVFPGPHQRLDAHPLSAITLRRKRTFDSREDARQNFESKSPFNTWDAEALGGYVQCGMMGDGPVELACDPEVEADIYIASNDHDTFEMLGEIEIPVLLLSGSNSDTTPPQVIRQQAAQFKRAGVEIVPEAGHFLPMEKPDVIAERIQRLVKILG